MNKFFEFHWNDGSVEYGKGKTEAEAASSLGITLGALRVMDYVCEAKEVPMESKDVRVLFKDGKNEVLSNGTLFVTVAREEVMKGNTDIRIQIAKAVWNFYVDVTPFEIVLKEY